MADTRKKFQAYVRLDVDDYEICRRAAKADRRSFSDWARLKLIDAAAAELAQRPDLRPIPFKTR